MRRVFLLLFLCALPLCVANAQDAEQKEKLDRLSADMEALLATNVKLQTEISKLKEELSRVREEASRPPATDAAIPGIREDLRKLAEKIQEVDRKRIDDTHNVAAEFEKLEKLIRNAATAAASEPRAPRTRPTPPSPGPSTSGKVFEYVVKPGDTLSKIHSLVNLQFKEEGKKTISQQQILDANPGLNPDRLLIGQKLYIPAE